MPTPEPFTAAALTAGVLTNIASDILQHHAQRLDGTLVGRVLKKARIIEPDFNDRMRTTLAQALSLYFTTYPDYNLVGVQTFFTNPVVAETIGDFILDRRPIDQTRLEEGICAHFGAEPISKVLLGQRGLDPLRIVPDFLGCYRKILNEHLGIPEIAILLEILDQSDASILEMQASEARIQEVLGRILAQHQILAADLQNIQHLLRIDRPSQVIIAEIEDAWDSTPRGSMFESGGLCSGYLLQPLPDRYFVAQEFRADRLDLRNALTEALSTFGLQPVVADDFYWGGPILCKISGLIQGTPFGIYQLTASQNRNVHLELGIALGLGRPFVLIKDRDAEVANLLDGLEYHQVNSYLEVRYDLGKQLNKFVASIGSFRPGPLPKPGSRKTAIIAHGGLDPIDFVVTIAGQVMKHGLIPVILGDPTGRLPHFLEAEGISTYEIVGQTGPARLDDSLAAIQAASIGVYRIDKESSADCFVALGVSIALKRSGVLVHRASSQPPSDVRGLAALTFSAYTQLGQSFARHFDYLRRAYSLLDVMT